MAKAYIYGIEDIATNLGLSTLLSSTTVVEQQGFTPNISQSIAAAIGNLGDILTDGSNAQATTPYDIKQNFSINLVTKQDANTGITVILGGAGATMIAPYNAAVSALKNFGIYSHFVLTGLSLSQPGAGFAKISLTGHAHFFNATTGSALQHIAQKYTIALPTFGFGIQQVPACNASPSTPALTLADMSNYTFGAEVQHTDELDRNGKFLIGASHGAKLTESFTFANYNDAAFGDVIQGQLFVPAANWQFPSDGRSPKNTGYEERTIQCETYQKHD